MNTPAHNFHRLAYSGLCRLESARLKSARRRAALNILFTLAALAVVYLWSYLP